ncbi:MFS transporter [Liquorilactobacillus satsumensis]|uniref:MFS transporter n=1 Tax=Liquorilactobacillus satsumensis TaxID=259059 RepID=UPI001E2AE714|nr:MFS transporter [Liquorilactobacillus satsumensis]MCC7666245.1 MFS transporter [Liquorilactobacillus satsumensis]MCP9313682.1 MFS transporter [Liquorilactobacillus satsumensis]MCP9327904.1 MFS transporter [Liquorilactobacillus satsumensis]MCP9358080.1 MFS transporter [Liquorilactobacillus satsumensis]MCP9360832.1 MFS transporter [Liquorilactobacillus satsumensis]
MNSNNKKIFTEPTLLNQHLVPIMSVAGAFTVANIYYAQPLLARIAQYYHVAEGSAGLLATLTQIGYALGLLLILPLADLIEKRRLILTMLMGATVFLLLLFFAPNISIAILASFGIGFCSVVPQLLIPFAVQLTNSSERGRVIGSIIGGLLLGILLSRVVSGLVGKYLIWKDMYLIAACMMCLLWISLRIALPKNYGKSSIKYSESLKSMFSLIRQFSVLREASIVGSMGFLAFSTFWTALVFLLQGSPYNMGADVAGLFGLVGIVGALFSKVAGKLSDKKGARFTVGINILVIIVAYLVFVLWGFHLWGLILGVILLDLGVQSSNVSNQARIHQLSDKARNRITSIYMVSYFLGGALGSWLGAFSFQHFGWGGVCVVGLFSQFIAVCAHLSGHQHKQA